MKKILSLFCCLIFSFSHAQSEYKTDKKGNWLVTNQFGFATLEADNAFKINVFVFEGLLGREFYINEKASIITGVELLRLKGDIDESSGNQLFLKNSYITIPISYRFYSDVNKPIVLYGGLGVYGSHLFRSKVENISMDESQIDTSTGFNFGLQVNLGVKYVLDKFSVSLGFKYKSDFADFYKDAKQEFELTDFYAVQLGLGFNL